MTLRAMTRRTVTMTVKTSRRATTYTAAGLAVLGLGAVAILPHVAAVPAHTVTRESPPALQQVDDAVREGNVSAAEQAWHLAYLEALRTRGSRSMLDVGAAYLRIGQVGRFEHVARRTARETYSIALVRAMSEGSVENVLRVAEAFARLGNREDVEHCLRSAEILAHRSNDPDGPRRLTSFHVQWSAGLLGPLEP